MSYNPMPFHQNLISSRYSNESQQRKRLNTQAEAELRAVIDKIADRSYVFEERPCAICNEHSFDVLAERDRYGLPIQTTICRTCGLIQTNPDMRDTDYADFYTHHYRRLYIADLVGQPEDFFQEEYWRGQRIVNYVLRRVSIPQNALVLEIGCGAGGILSAFSKRGYRTIGTDLGVDNLEYGRRMGLDLRTGDLFGLELHEAPSLIIYSHVLEHIRDPGRTLNKVSEILGPDGHLYIEVPGVKDVRNNVFQGDFLRTFHLAHIYNFSLLTLTNLLAKYGFERLAGDETIRSIFRPGEARYRFESAYTDLTSYIKRTEQHRGFYRRRYRLRGAVRNTFYRLRSTTFGMLRRTGLHNSIKRLLRR